MKKTEIIVGSHYTARVSGSIVTVRVDAIRESFYKPGRSRNVYDVTNLRTARKLVFQSAAKFRSAVNGTPDSERQHRETTVPTCGKLSLGGTYGCTRPKNHAGLCNGDSAENHQFTGEPRVDSLHPNGF